MSHNGSYESSEDNLFFPFLFLKYIPPINPESNNKPKIVEIELLSDDVLAPATSWEVFWEFEVGVGILVTIGAVVDVGIFVGLGVAVGGMGVFVGVYVLGITTGAV